MQFVGSRSLRNLKSPVLAVALAGVMFVQPVFASAVLAQTVTIVDDQAPVSSASPTASTSPLPSPSPEDTQLTQLRDKYKTDLSIYRTDEHDFVVAKEQYRNLQTLASLEASVKATRKVMVTRIMVLQDYLQILRSMVNSTSGIDVKEKAQLISELDAQIDLAKTHQQLVEQAIDRGLVLRAAQDFNVLNVGIVTASYKALSYIAYGRLQTVYDKTLAVRDEVTASLEQQEKNGLKLGEKRRALDEINRNLDDTKIKLETQHDSFLPNSFGKVPKFSNDTYGVTLQGLSTIYADLFRNLNLLREVVKS